jgi:NAD+ diphosphatase
MFVPSVTPPTVRTAQDWWFVFRRHDLLILAGDDEVRVPTWGLLESLPLSLAGGQYLGALDGVSCYCADVDEIPPHLPESAQFSGLRGLFERLPSDLFWTAGRAAQFAHWNRTHQFCGGCGHLTEYAADERAKRCPRCGQTSYPRISPAVIVAVVNDAGELLLAHAPRFPKGMYSVLAGFVEPGETFEDAVRREVKEEVNVDVTDIRYFGSQPWPFPDSLMVAFTARYAGGDMRVDNVEITDAGWYRADNLPQIPGKISVARQLIDWFAGL